MSSTNSNNEEITIEEVKKIVKLAQLDEEKEDLQLLASELNSVLGYVKILKNYESSNINPMTHLNGQVNVFREDINEDHLTPEEVLRNSPDSSGKFFRVPLIIE